MYNILYEVIECLGILIDNAIEATNEGGTILAKIGSQDDKLESNRIHIVWIDNMKKQKNKKMKKILDILLK